MDQFVENGDLKELFDFDIETLSDWQAVLDLRQFSLIGEFHHCFSHLFVANDHLSSDVSVLRLELSIQDGQCLFEKRSETQRRIVGKVSNSANSGDFFVDVFHLEIGVEIFVLGIRVQREFFLLLAGSHFVVLGADLECERHQFVDIGAERFL